MNILHKKIEISLNKIVAVFRRKDSDRVALNQAAMALENQPTKKKKQIDCAKKTMLIHLRSGGKISIPKLIIQRMYAVC